MTVFLFLSWFTCTLNAKRNIWVCVGDIGNFPLKAWTLLVTSQAKLSANKINCGNEKSRAVDSIQNCEKRLPLNIVFEKEVISTQIIEYFRPEAFYYASESKQTCATRVFLFQYSLAIFDDQLSPNFHRFVIWCFITCWDIPSLWKLPKVSGAFLCIISVTLASFD